MAYHHSAFYSALWDPDVRVPSSLLQTLIPNSTVIATANPSKFDLEVFVEEEEPKIPEVWKSITTGIDNPVHLLWRQRGARGQHRKALHSQSQSSGKQGGRCKLDLDDRPS